MNKLILKNKKIWFLGFFALIILTGIFLRTYHYNDWLFFQGDQARDAHLVSKAYDNGPANLPLLGPRAGGTFTRLGPVFYYFEYVAILIFGKNSPAHFAYPDLLFSILTMPLFYLFLKKYFDSRLSVFLTLLYAVCFYAVQYSRFAWNPNSLPFFSLLFFYAFLNIFDSEDSRKKIIWSIIAGLAYAIVSQLHFLSLVTIPIIAASFIILRHKYIKSIENFKWRTYILVVLSAVVVLYVPVIFSEILTHGNNSLSFIASSMNKTSSSNLGSSLLDTFSKFSEYFLVIWTGIVGSQDWLRNIASIFMVAGILFNIALFINEKEEKRKNLLMIVVLWLAGYFFVYTFVKPNISSRFFLPVLPIPFLLLGFVAVFFMQRFRKRFIHWLAVAVIILLAASNAYSVSIWFKEVKNSELGASVPRKSELKKAVSADTWWHLEKTSNFMKNDCQKETILIFPPQKKYAGVFEYAMKNIGKERSFLLNWETAVADSQACYYAVRFTKNIAKDFNGGIFEEGKISQFGDFSVVKLNLINTDIKDGQVVNNPYRNKNKDEDVSNTDEDSISDENDSQTADSSDDNSNTVVNNDAGKESGSKLIVPRLDRLFWSDVAEYFKK